MPRQLHPHFLRHARVRQNRVEAVAQQMKAALGEIADALALDDHRVKPGLHNDADESFAQAMLAARPLHGELRAEEARRAEGRNVFQMFDDMKVHRHDHLLVRLALVVDDDALFRVDIFPLHLDAVAETRTDEIPEEDELWCKFLRRPRSQCA